MIPYDTKIIMDTNRTTAAVKSGVVNDDIIAECRGHCKYMVRHGMSHNGFSDRSNRLQQKYQNFQFSEIVAMNMESNPIAAARSFYQQWRHSSGHWRILCSLCDIYGFSLCVYEKKYYGIGLFGKKS